ncbi:MAG: nitrate reductase [Acidimicrobiia bacterium]|nr:nitrate reductase [Acidimicrobiia bacterium]
MGDATAVATAFRYPNPGSLERLKDVVSAIESRPVRHAMENFLSQISNKELSEWEELHTDTLDLSPKFVPYVGHAVWGENYRRGSFMADMSREINQAGLDLFGELPDHIDPILRYLDTVEEPFTDVVEVLPQALMRMSKELAKAEKSNPYRHVLDAAQTVAEELIESRRKAVT